MSAELPESHADLLERPLFAHLATIRPDGSPQSSVMWFAWDGRRARFSHTSSRQKYRNLLAEGRVSFHVQDPDNAYRPWRSEVGSNQWTLIRRPPFTAASSDATAPKAYPYSTPTFVSSSSSSPRTTWPWPVD